MDTPIFEKKNVLVTGGAGFIGSHLCERLLKQAREMGYEVAVKIPLKSPSTAEYGRVDVEQVATNIYKVSGYIDSQNGFGAMIRSYWQAKLTYSGEDTQQGVESVSNWKMSGLKVE
jgi:hypothetical protein